MPPSPTWFAGISILTTVLSSSVVGQDVIAEFERQVVGMPVVEGLDKPVGIAALPDGRLLVLEREGRIRVADPRSGALGPPILDIARRVTSTNWEQGLLGGVLHPGFADNGYLFVNYVDGEGATRISRFTATGGGETLALDEATELLLLRVPQPGDIHNGGGLAFGPHDGYLYVGLGDGELGDPGRNAQDRGSLLGKLLRLDVDRRDGNRPYRIPRDNPFASDWRPGTRGEVVALGLRNPWRIAFDTDRSILYIGDVGQAEREEIDAVAVDDLLGANFGWRCREGSRPFKPAECSGRGDLVDPIFEYTHTAGCAVVGGVVYEGVAEPDLVGRYVFTDFCSGDLFLLWPEAGDWRLARAGSLGRAISSFGTDRDGEVYALGYLTGDVRRLSTVRDAPQGVGRRDEGTFTPPPR